MKPYKAIFLDWDDTIGDWTGAELKSLRDIYQTYHLEELYATPEDYIAAYKPYNLELWGLYGQGKIAKDDLHFRRFYKPIEGLRVENQESRVKMALEMGAEFLRLTNQYFSVLPGADEVVRELAKHYPLTIISNGFKEVQYYKFAHSGLADCFAHTLISEEIGINKPQPGIFQIALELNNIKAEEAVMIGDSYSSDIQGAKNAGIDQIWLHQGDAPETATYIVPRLADVLSIV